MSRETEEMRKDSPLSLERMHRMILKQMNRSGAFTSSLGVEITEVGDLTAEGAVSTVDVHVNPMGSIHGGVLFTLMDAVGGAAGASSGRGCATIDCTAHFLRAATPGNTLRCRAKCVKSGRHIMIVKTVVTDQEDRELAEGIFTYQRTNPIDDYPV